MSTALPPRCRRVLKKGRNNYVPRIPIFKKENGGLKLYFQTADISNRKIVVEQRFCVWGAVIQKMIISLRLLAL